MAQSFGRGSNVSFNFTRANKTCTGYIKSSYFEYNGVSGGSWSNSVVIATNFCNLVTNFGVRYGAFNHFQNNVDLMQSVGLSGVVYTSNNNLYAVGMKGYNAGNKSTYFSNTITLSDSQVAEAEANVIFMEEVRKLHNVTAFFKEDLNWYCLHTNSNNSNTYSSISKNFKLKEIELESVRNKRSLLNYYVDNSPHVDFTSLKLLISDELITLDSFKSSLLKLAADINNPTTLISL